MLRSLRIGFLTTRSSKGVMTSRPLLTVNSKHDVGRRLRFFVSADSLWIRDIALDTNVSVVYADVHQSQFVAVSGSARLVRNSSLQQALWTPWIQQTFPSGPLDPTLRILEVTIELVVLQSGGVLQELTWKQLDNATPRDSTKTYRPIHHSSRGQSSRQPAVSSSA